MTDSLQKLIEDASRGHAPAVDELLARHVHDLHAFVRLRAGPAILGRESVADLVQSVCREVLERVGDFEYRGEAPFRAWLFTQALHKIVDRNRYYHRAKRDVDREARIADAAESAADLVEIYGTICTPSRVAAAREEVERVERLFQQLSEDQREAITLSRIAGLGYAEIADRMGRTESAIRGLVARGLSKLSTWMADDQE